MRYWRIRASTYMVLGNTIQRIKPSNNYSFANIFQRKAYNHLVSEVSRAVPIVQMKELRLREMQ